ncbi:hypothetical protein SAMN05446935_8033 [Burkholderia sp. YR290]|uniref:Uncharacterized protein n=1 Tax=Paraburkholderia hospita TaxID=169430 RepID=A0ABN0F770_9BURK|nr:hypothetical protein WQE_44183 [Paraburkholderia hospita]SKD03853.1 hypothetical protein SAMN05445504_9005 [Burkholderia sp. CF099]SOE87409.1 hypothetical protein SAMN05446935_8033 [Burkholderia sp. YR290]OUL73301.1 hypothetical protein CA601_44210 [Paraburkholderia hospita]OUL80593.1 hypothetical protein CA602_27645 [Paraburkholderia hospita]
MDAGSGSQDGHNEWSGDEINEFEPETNRVASTEVRRPGFHAVRDRYTIGKGRHTVIPDLLTYPDSIIVGGIKEEILARVIRM